MSASGFLFAWICLFIDKNKECDERDDYKILIYYITVVNGPGMIDDS